MRFYWWVWISRKYVVFVPFKVNFLYFVFIPQEMNKYLINNKYRPKSDIFIPIVKYFQNDGIMRKRIKGICIKCSHMQQYAHRSFTVNGIVTIVSSDIERTRRSFPIYHLFKMYNPHYMRYTVFCHVFSILIGT